MKKANFIFLTVIIFLSGCYSLFPTEELDNGIPQDSRTWKYYQMGWKAGSEPELESLLHSYYNDCNPKCVFEYLLTVNLIGGLKTIKKRKIIPNGTWIFLSEIDTCDNLNYCKGRFIKFESLNGDLKRAIKNFLGMRYRLPVNLNESENPQDWDYFKIFARTSDDTIFSLLQDDLYINPKLESYTLEVNITDKNPINQFVSIGDINDPSAIRYAWSQFSNRVQVGLKNWKGKNKIRY